MNTSTMIMMNLRQARGVTDGMIATGTPAGAGLQGAVQGGLEQGKDLVGKAGQIVGDLSEPHGFF